MPKQSWPSSSVSKISRTIFCTTPATTATSLGGCGVGAGVGLGVGVGACVGVDVAVGFCGLAEPPVFGDAVFGEGGVGLGSADRVGTGVVTTAANATALASASSRIGSP
jgi:hypothetical protein